jgi:hypothetical protein
MIKLPATRPETTKAFDSLASAFAKDGVEKGAMFGMPSLKANGKAFAGVFGDALVFKLGGDTHAGALALSGAVLFDPSGTGRAMKEWVVVPYAHQKRWVDLGRAALAHLGASTAKKPAAKTAVAKKVTAKKAVAKKR